MLSNELYISFQNKLHIIQHGNKYDNLECNGNKYGNDGGSIFLIAKGGNDRIVIYCDRIY